MFFKNEIMALRRLGFVRDMTSSNIFEAFRWIFEKRSIYNLEEKIITEVNRAGGAELWGISGRTGILILYSLVRAMKPDIFIETGVASGSSSYVILQAMKKNGKGSLYSIDYPETWSFDPKGKKSGWIVPYELRYRWNLSIGKSSDLLPELLDRKGSVDIFLHDSEHSYENMMFEFDLAWDYIQDGGCLVSHDINWNSAFRDFCKAKRQKPIIWDSFGIIRKF